MSQPIKKTELQPESYTPKELPEIMKLAQAQASAAAPPAVKAAPARIKARLRNQVRIVELPACKMVWSGVCPGDHSTAKNEALRCFSEWWSAQDKLRKDRFYARDFMWYDHAAQGFAWGLALTDVPEDTNGYEVIDFPGGLYAVANYNGDASVVYNDMKKWIDKSGCFAPDDGVGRYGMYHFINAPAAAAAMGYGQYDLYLPIRIKGDVER